MHRGKMQIKIHSVQMYNGAMWEEWMAELWGKALKLNVAVLIKAIRIDLLFAAQPRRPRAPCRNLSTLSLQIVFLTVGTANCTSILIVGIFLGTV